MNKSGEQQKAQDVFAQIGRYTIWCEIFSFFYSEVTDFTYNIYSDYHAHRAFDIHYPIKGSYYIVTEKEKILAKAGQLVIIAPGVYHTSQAIDAVWYELPAKEGAIKNIAGEVLAYQH